MTKIMKRLTFVGFIAVLVVALTACGNNGSGNSAKSANNSGNQSSKSSSDNGGKSNNSKSDNGTTTKTAKKMDLGGRTITLEAWWDAAPQNTSLSGKELIAQQKKVEQEYNVKIKYVNVPFGDVTKKFTSSVLSGQPFADIARLQYDWALTAAGKKELQPIGSFAPDMTKYNHVKTMDKINGQYYGFDNKTAVAAAGLYYNREIFKKLNLPDPHQLIKEGKWNWSEFEKLAKQATVDSNGDGKNDYWGFSGWETDMINFLVPSNGAQIVNLSTGKVDLTNPKVEAAFEEISKLYNTDHVVKVEPKSKPSNWKERDTFKDGDVAMTYGWLWQSGTWKGIDYGFVPFPKGPSATDWVSPFVTANEWTIPKGVKNPAAVMAIYNDLQDVKPTEDYPGQNYFEQNLKHQDDIDSAKMLASKYYVPPYAMFDFSKTKIYNMIGDVVDGHKAVASVMKTYQPQTQAAVTATLNGGTDTKKKSSK